MISKLKYLDKVYITNNICEIIHSNISKYIGENKISKNTFRDTLNYILSEYSIKSKNNIRKDYVSRTIIYLIEKYELNENPKFLEYNLLNKELQNTIAIMSGEVRINVIMEITKSLENIDEENSDNIIDITKEEDEVEIFDKNNYDTNLKKTI